jgi:type VI secretion system protein ImpB
MAKEGSIAPKERINIVYRPATNMDEEIELPFKLVVMGDFTGREDDTPLEDRKRINIDKDNFNEVLKEQRIGLTFGVGDKLSPDAQEGDEMAVNLQIDSMKSFDPEQIIQQVPELRSLLEVREALVALKGPLGNVKNFSKKLKEVLADDAARERLMRELKLGGGGTGGTGGDE